jgi:hypothetical protein
MARALLAGFVALALALPAAAQADPKAVVETAIKAHGGADALNKSKTARAKSKGTLVISGQGEAEFVSTAVYSIPDKFKLEMAADVRGLKLTATQYVVAKQVTLKVTLAGVEQPSNDRVKDETAQAVLLQEITTLTPLVETKKYTLAAEKDDSVDGKAAAVVLVTGNGAKEVRLYFDKETGRLVKTKRKGLAQTDKGLTDVVEESYLLDFKPNGGALLPTKLKVTHDGKKYMDVVVNELTFLEKVDGAEFVPPAK